MASFPFPAGRAHVDVDVEVWGAQHPVPAFPNPQLISRTIERWDVGGLVVRVIDAQVDVDDRFGRKARNRARANVVDAPGERARSAEDPGSFVVEPLGQDGSYETIAIVRRSGPPINTTSSSIAGHRSITGGLPPPRTPVA